MLDAPTWLERASAEQRLLSLATLRLPQLEEQIAIPTLTLEQRTRLERVAKVLFVNAPRAAMGVSFDLDRQARGVEIQGTVQDFDSSRQLRPGDVLLAIDGVSIDSTPEARATIVSYDPGATITLELVRNGVTMQVPVRLGDFRELRNTQGLDTATLERSWLARLARARVKGNVPALRALDTGLGMEDLRQAEQRERENEPSAEPEEHVAIDLSTQNSWDAMGETLRTLNVTPGGGIRDVSSDASSTFFLESPPQGETAERLRELSDNLNRMTQQLRLNEGMLRNGQLPASRRAEVEAAVEQTRRNLRMARQSLREARKQLMLIETR